MLLLVAGLTAVFSAVAAGAQKLVVGHQMLHMPRYGMSSSDAGLLEEIKQWRDMGLDGVMLFDLNDDPRRNVAKRYHAVSVANGTPVKFALTHFSMNSDPHYLQLSADYLADLAAPAYANARLFYEGKYLLSSYWQDGPGIIQLTKLAEPRTGPIHLQPDVALRDFSGTANTQPYFTSGWYTGASQRVYELLAGHPDWSRADGIAQFNIAVGIEAQVNQLRALWDAAKAKGKSARGSIVPYYRGQAHRGNWMVTEAWGFKRLQYSWQGAIDSGIPTVELITLNDFAEVSYFNSWAPDDPPVLVRHWDTSNTPALLDHSGFREFQKRYVDWFKTGVAPAITKDELYFSYRPHPRDAQSYYYLSEQEKTALARWVSPQQPVDRLYRKDTIPTTVDSQGGNGLDWKVFSDGIHTAVRLTAPAEVYINGTNMGTFGAGEHLITKPGAIAGGTTDHGYPMHTFGPSDFGYPTFEIRRNGQSVIKYVGELEITPYCVPGAWNTLARQAIPGRVHTSFANLAPGQSVPSETSFTLLTPVTGDTGKVARVEYYSGNSKLGEDASAPYTLDWKPTTGRHTLTAKVIKHDGSSYTSDACNVIANPPPASVNTGSIILTAQDLGGSPTAGSTTANGGVITVKGSGTDIYGTADEFHYAWRKIEGDCTIITRVDAATGASGAKAGIMMRESLTAGSRNIFAFTRPAQNTAEVFRREAEDTTTYQTYYEANLKGPIWLRLQRAGDTFTASHSTDGSSWTPFNGIWWWTAKSSVYVGLAVTSTSTSSLATATFSHTSITGTDVATVTVATPTLVAPQTGATFPAGSTVDLTATFSANTSTLARVEFYAAATKLGEDTTAPYTYSWSGAAVGVHALSARAVATAGITASSTPVTITVGSIAAAPTPTLTAPGSGASVTHGTTINLTASLPNTSDVARVEFYAGAAKIGEDTSSPYAYTWNGAAVGAHSLTARSVTTGGTTASSAAVVISVTNVDPTITYPTPGSNPVVLTAQDIGAPALAGQTSVNPTTGQLTVVGGGTDIWYASDQFHFAWREFNGDFTVQARVESISPTNPWAKAGLMARESLAAGSRFAAAFFTPENGAVFQYRTADNAAAQGATAVPQSSPAWLKLERIGSTITAWSSANGTTWTVLGTRTIAFGSRIHLGVAVTAHTPAALATALVSELAFTVPGPEPAPVPTLTAPAAGTVFDTGSSITLSATVPATTNVARVEFYDGATKVGEDATSPFSLSWTGANIGSHVLSAKAVTTGGATADSGGVSVAVRAAAPLPTLTSPTPATVFDVGSAITLGATLSDTTDVTRVEFYAGGAKIGEDSSSPYAVGWTGATVGAHAITARSVTTAGATATSAVSNITVRALAPKPTITAPNHGSTVDFGAALTITATLSSSTGVARVEFFAGTTLLGQDATSPYSYNWTNAAGGVHALTARAVTNAGATATSAPVSVTVRVPAPLPSITSPASGTTFASGNAIAITASLGNTLATVARVEFYAGGILLGQDASAPYSFSWANASAGTYALTVRAVTTDGASATSSSLSITVTAPRPNPGTPLAGGTVNVRDYGAKGDGLTDDTQAIRDAIAAVGRATGTVYLPAGTYLISPQASGGDALAINTNNLSLRGDGPARTILSFRTFGGGNPATSWQTLSGVVHRGAAVVIEGSDSRGSPRHNVVIADLRLTGNAAPTGSLTVPANPVSGDGWDASHRAIEVLPGTYVDGLRLENIELDNFRGELVFAAGATNGLIEILDSRIHGSNAIGVSASADLRLTNNDIYDHAYACVLAEHLNRATGFAQHGYYLGNTLEPRRTLTTNGLRGLVLRSEGTGADSVALAPDELFLVVEGNTIKNSLHYGIIADQDVFEVLITNNTFLDNGTTGEPQYGNIAFLPGQANGGSGIARGALVTDNTFRATGARPSGYAVFLNAGTGMLRNVTIDRNTLTNPTSGSYFIRRYLLLSSHTGSVVTEVRFTNNTANSINAPVEDLTKHTHPTPRPLFNNNTVPATSFSFSDDDFAPTAAAPAIAPAWAHARVIPAVDRLAVTLAPQLSLYPDFTAIKLSVGTGSRGILLEPGAWNRLNTALYVAGGSSVSLVKKAGRFEVIGADAIAAGPLAPATPLAPPPAPLAIALTAPTTDASIPAGQTVTFTASISGGTSTVAYVEFFESGVALGRVTSSPFAHGWTPPGPGTYSAFARVVDHAGNVATSPATLFTVSRPAATGGAPDRLQHADIGAPALTGAARYDQASGSYSIDAAGTDVWGQQDEFRFAHQPFTGNGELVVRVDSLVATNAWAKAGLMIRSSLSADASHGFMFASPESGVAFQRRTTTGGETTHTGGSGSLAVWLKLRREGDVIIASSSSNGTTWTEMGRETIVMPRTVYAGLAVTSHNAGTRTTATFSHLAITSSDDVYLSTGIGKVSVDGYGLFNETYGAFTLAGAGRDIWGRQDEFHFMHRTATGDATIMSTVEQLDGTSPWAKAGIMLRTSLAADAANVLLAVTPANGLMLQTRTTDGSVTVGTNIAGIRTPAHLALERVGNSVTAFYSTDGTTWHIAGTITIDLPATVHMGMAVTSRQQPALATARFSDTGIVP